MLPGVTLVVVALSCCLQNANAADSYATKYDHIDVDTILNNRRMVNYYAACMLSKGPCPPEGLEFKRILPEALHTNCIRCTEKQKTVTLRAIKRLKKEYPKVWAQLAEIWDPDGSYFVKFEASFNNRKTPSVVVPLAVPIPLSTSVTTSAPVPEVSSTTRLVVESSTSTTKPIITNTLITSTSTIKSPTTKSRPTATVGVNLRNPVSFGSDLVGGLVRGLNNLGTAVVETGSQIAGAVLQGVQRVVRPF